MGRRGRQAPLPVDRAAQDLIDDAPRGTGLLVPGRNEGIKAADPPAAYSQDLRSLKRRLRDESWSALVARNPHSICTKLERRVSRKQRKHGGAAGANALLHKLSLADWRMLHLVKLSSQNQIKSPSQNPTSPAGQGIAPSAACLSPPSTSSFARRCGFAATTLSSCPKPAVQVRCRCWVACSQEAAGARSELAPYSCTDVPASQQQR